MNSFCPPAFWYSHHGLHLSQLWGYLSLQPCIFCLLDKSSQDCWRFITVSSLSPPPCRIMSSKQRTTPPLLILPPFPFFPPRSFHLHCLDFLLQWHKKQHLESRLQGFFPNPASLLSSRAPLKPWREEGMEWEFRALMPLWKSSFVPGTGYTLTWFH